MNKVQHFIPKEDGSCIRITAQEMFSAAGLHRSVDIYVHRREDENSPWDLLGNQPAPNWREMSVDDYTKNGRPPMVYHTTFAQRAQVTRALEMQNEIIAAGYTIVQQNAGTPAQGWYALLPGETEFFDNIDAHERDPENVPHRQNYLGFFSSQLDLIHEVHDEVVAQKEASIHHSRPRST